MPACGPKEAAQGAGAGSDGRTAASCSMEAFGRLLLPRRPVNRGVRPFEGVRPLVSTRPLRSAAQLIAGACSAAVLAAVKDQDLAVLPVRPPPRRRHAGVTPGPHTNSNPRR